MPPTRKRDFLVLVIDLRADRNFIYTVLDKLLVHKSLLESNEEAYVIFMHCKDEYRNFKFVRYEDPIRLVNDNLLGVLYEHFCIMGGENVISDWNDVIEEALTVFDNYGMVDKNIFTRQLIFISDFAHDSHNSSEAVKKYAKELRKQEIAFIAVIPNKVTYREHRYIESKNDLKALMQRIEIQGMTDELKKVVCIAQHAQHGIVCQSIDFLDFVEVLSNVHLKQPFTMPLQLGTYEFMTSTRKILSSVSAVVCRRFRKRDTTFRRELNWDDEVGASTVVDQENVMPAYKFHGKILTLPDDVQQSFKAQHPPIFKIVGFVREELIPDVYIGGSETFSITVESTTEHINLFVEFVKSVLDAKKYALATRVYNKTSMPKLYVLVPQEAGWFLMVELHGYIDYQKIIDPVEAGGDLPDNLSEGMMELRRELLLGRWQGRFHPSCSIGIQRELSINGVRKYVGYNTEYYKPEVRDEEDEPLSASLTSQEFIQEFSGTDPVVPVAVQRQEIIEIDEDDDW